VELLNARKDEMGGACGTYRGEKVTHTGFWRGNVKEMGGWEDNIRMDF